MSKTPRTDEGGLILIDELQMLIDSKPGVFDVHYVDEVKRIAQQALWAIQQGNIALEAANELTAAKEKIAEQEVLFRAVTYIANPENWIDEEKMRHPVQNSPVPGAVVTISAQKYAQKIVAEFQL